MKHPDEAQDKALIKKMMSKQSKSKSNKVVKHLKKDIKDQAHGIKEDAALIKKMRSK